MNWSLGFAAFVLLSLVSAGPLKLHKSGEERAPRKHAVTDVVKDTVSKAEAAARKAAQERIKQGHKAESRIPADKEKHAKEQLEKLEHESKVASQLLSLDSNSVKEQNTKRVQEGGMFHVRHHYPNKFHGKPHFEGPRHEMGEARKLHHKGHGGLFDFGDISTSSNSPRAYTEDTGLEDRLAMEAEEEKKYETGENYGNWGGGGGGTGKSGISSWDLQSNIQKQDAAEKQSIQAQVASESAHELEEIQREIAQESQTSRGVTSVGGESASVGQEAPSMKGMGRLGGMDNPFSRQMAEFARPQQKSFGGMMDESSEISRMVKQAQKLSPGEMNAPNIGNYGMGNPNHGSLDMSRLAAAFTGQQGGGLMGPQEEGQQGGFQEQAASFQGGEMQGGAEGAPGQPGLEQAMSQAGQLQGLGGGMEQGGMEQRAFAGMAEHGEMGGPGMGALGGPGMGAMGGPGMGAMPVLPGMQGITDSQEMPEGASPFTGAPQEPSFGAGGLPGGPGGAMPEMAPQMMQQTGPYKKSTVPQRPWTESKTHYKKKSHHNKHKKHVKSKTEKSSENESKKTHIKNGSSKKSTKKN